jgi:hypothetical protein
MALKRKEAAHAETLSAETITRAETQRRRGKQIRTKSKSPGRIGKSDSKRIVLIFLSVSAPLREMALLEIALRERMILWRCIKTG